jgi:heme A synthase
MRNMLTETVPTLKKFALVNFYICGLQILLGVINILFRLPVIITALHTGTGVALLVSIYISLYLRMAILRPVGEIEEIVEISETGASA